MTDKMQKALNHIKSAVDVDEWAVEEVERVFNAIDEIKAEIKSLKGTFPSEVYLNIIDKHIGKESE